MQATKSITKRQKEVLNFVIQFMAKNGYSPSLQEIARFLGTKNISTAQYFIQELEEKGYLKKKSHIARGVSPLSQTTPARQKAPRDFSQGRLGHSN